MSNWIFGQNTEFCFNVNSSCFQKDQKLVKFSRQKCWFLIDVPKCEFLHVCCCLFTTSTKKVLKKSSITKLILFLGFFSLQPREPQRTWEDSVRASSGWCEKSKKTVEVSKHTKETFQFLPCNSWNIFSDFLCCNFV